MKSNILCGPEAYKIHIKSKAVFVHRDDTVEVAHGKFTDKGSNVDMTMLEPGVSFLQVCKGIHDNEREIKEGQESNMCEQMRNSPHQAGYNCQHR